MRDQVQRLGRVIFRQHDRAAAGEHHRQPGAGAADMEAGHGEQGDLAGDRLLPVHQILFADSGAARREDRAVGHDRALGVAGRARCIELQGVVILGAGDHRIDRIKAIAPGRVARELPFRFLAAQDQLDMLQVIANLAGQFVETGSDKEQPRLAVVQDIGDLGRRQPPVDRHHHRAELGRADQDFEIEMAVLAHIGDPVALPHTLRRQRLRRPVAAGIERGIGHLVVFEGEDHRVRLLLRLETDHVANGNNIVFGHANILCARFRDRLFPHDT